MHCLWINKPVSNWPPSASLFSLWTSHWILDIESVSETSYRNFKYYHQYCKSGDSQIHTVLVQDQQLRSFKVANANASTSNGTKHDPKRRMESAVSGTDSQEGRHVDQPATSAQVKLDVNLARTSPQPIIYTTAQLHEITKFSKSMIFKYLIFIWIFRWC